MLTAATVSRIFCRLQQQTASGEAEERDWNIGQGHDALYYEQPCSVFLGLHAKA